MESILYMFIGVILGIFSSSIILTIIKQKNYNKNYNNESDRILYKNNRLLEKEGLHLS